MSQFSAQEQYFLELVNRARMNPLGEAARYGISLNEGLAAGTISSASKQVLAPNSVLNTAARAHSQHMIDVDQFNHSGIGDGTMQSRVEAVGYDWATLGENLAWTSGNSIASHHQNLFLSSGHRTNIFGSNFKEVGIGSLTGTYNYNGTPYSGSLMTTQNFGASSDAIFVTGVNYRESVSNDNFYTVGEAETGRTVKLLAGSVTLVSGSTWTAGGFALKTSATGSVEIVFSGGDLSAEKGAKFTLGNTNVKVDMVDSSTIDANVSITLTRGSYHAHLLGINNISATGNSKGNYLYGNSGANKIKGESGDDKLWGGKGADTMDGGSGADQYYYTSKSQGGDTISSFDASDVFVFRGTAFGNLAATHDLSTTYFRTVHSGNSAGSTTKARFVFNDTDDTLWFDADGTGVSAASKIATFNHDTPLTAADIWIV